MLTLPALFACPRFAPPPICLAEEAGAAHCVMGVGVPGLSVQSMLWADGRGGPEFTMQTADLGDAVDGLKWSSAYETGHPEIDSDHRNLFALVEGIREGLAKRDPGLTSSLVQEFIDASARHYAKEEEILVGLSFPDIDAHRVYHASLLAKAKQLRQVCAGEIDPEKADACYKELVAFLIDDVIKGDSQFMSYLSQYGVARKEH